jgi:hypothetical protein
MQEGLSKECIGNTVHTLPVGGRISVDVIKGKIIKNKEKNEGENVKGKKKQGRKEKGKEGRKKGK